MDKIINPDRLVSVPLSKTCCDVNFYINAAINKDIGLMLIESKRLRANFPSFYFFRKANRYLLLNFRRTELHDGMVLLLSPHQQQEQCVGETALDYTLPIFCEGFIHTFIVDKFLVFRLLYCYRTNTPPYTSATHDEMKEYIQLLGEIRYELMDLVPGTYDIIVSLLHYLLLVINRVCAVAYCLFTGIAKSDFIFRFKGLLEQDICTYQRVQKYTDMLCVNRTTFNNSVKAQFGVSAARLAEQRLFEGLRNELLFSDHTASEMADDFNFSDLSHLIRFFKQQIGKAFTQYMTDHDKDIYE